MNNCIILGSGRSGTSMIAGVLHQVGYFLGDKLYKPRDTNPKGFFEWKEINSINEQILFQYNHNVINKIKQIVTKKTNVYAPGKNQRWLLSLSPEITVQCTNKAIINRIKKVLENQPFCYKDPRFSYTIPVWRPFLPDDSVFICMFREPNKTIESIVKECRTRDYLERFDATREDFYRLWANIYSHIIKNSENNNKVIYCHYNQIYNHTAIKSLTELLGVELNFDFVDKSLNRSVSQDIIPNDVLKIYSELCELAKYKPS